ncbi:hypothetical protein [Corallococcus sicarius]|uniref:Exo-alpha-sialidase n=1 Tax=Corallococcus sicarius TaxID=2316726 RepID=A0A3A8NGS8_9BACT|nr:hypothetical protein [Corallococcus sicarius]RKH42580.1 hypothetical protein D7X12_15350 [Corallococcus sicarius]
MAVGKGRWFIGVGLLIGWLGMGCGSSAPDNREEEPSTRPESVDPGGSDAGTTVMEEAAPSTEVDGGIADAGEPGPQEEADAGTADAGPLPEPEPSDCDALPSVVPEAPPEGRLVEHEGYRYLNCGATASDGRGAVVVSWTHYSYNPIDIEAYGPGGDGWRQTFGSDTFEPYGQANGFLSFSLSNQYSLSYLDSRTWQLTHYPREPHDLMKSAAAPRGGLRAIFLDGTLKAYGPTGETLWSTPVPLSGPLRAMGVDARGHTLLVTVGYPEDGSEQVPVHGLWVDASGQPGTPFLALAQAPVPSWDTTYEFVAQAEQGLFLGITYNGARTWTAFAPLESQTHAPPAWLAINAEQPLLRLPNGKGYIRWSRPLACQHEAEFLSASGRSCGKTRFPAMPPDRIGRCGSMSMGSDGTVIETFPRDQYYWDPEASNPYYCRVRWWPALFKPWTQPE